jgi:hypothetical protein
MEMLVAIYRRTKRCHNTDDHNMDLHHCEKLKFRFMILFETVKSLLLKEGLVIKRWYEPHAD